jgi:hypothetical protein
MARLRYALGSTVGLWLSGHFHGSPALAQSTAPKLTNNNYTLEISQGPITSASRIVGMAGAFTALAEWCEGVYANAASPAIRAPYSVESFDYDVCLGWTTPGAFAGTDFENRSSAYPNDSYASRFNNSVTTNVGLQLQFGRFGVTVNYDGATYGLDETQVSIVPGQPQGMRMRLDRVTAATAWSLFDGQLLLGVGTRVAITALDNAALEGTAATAGNVGANVQAGIIIRPNGAPWRLGATYRNPIRVQGMEGAPDETLPDGTQVAAGYVLPGTVSVPLEIEVGGAWQFGRRPLNPVWIDAADLLIAAQRAVDEARVSRSQAYAAELAKLPEGPEREARRRYFERQEIHQMAEEDRRLSKEGERIRRGLKARASLWSRSGVTLHGTVLLTGTSINAVGMSGFLNQTMEPYGSFITVSPRLALETEVVPGRLTVRGGTYLEPNRFEGGVSRGHATLGTDVALIPWTAWGLFANNPWRLRLAVDGAPRYFNFAFAIGQYH